MALAISKEVVKISLGDSLGYRSGRNISKAILVLSAIAISTFAMSGWLANIVNFKLFFEIRNWLALSMIIVILLVREDIINPPSIPFFSNRFDRSMTKIVYYILLGMVAIGISTIHFWLVDSILDLTYPNFEILAVRNLAAIILLYSARKIHISG